MDEPMKQSPRRAVDLLDFDYQVIAPEHRDAVREDARQIRNRLVETAGSLIDIGERLVRVREMLPHGAWLPWLVTQTGMSEQWARNCVNLFRCFAHQPLLLADLDVALPPTALIRFASAPEAAREDIVNCVREGRKLRVVDVENTIRRHRECQRSLARSSSPEGGKASFIPGIEALRGLSQQAVNELLALTVQRMSELLDILTDAESRLAAGKRVTSAELQGLREDAQWLTDALEQLTQRSAGSNAPLVHRTFLPRRIHDAGPLADAASFLADIASSDGCRETIKSAGIPVFVARGTEALRRLLGTDNPDAPHRVSPRLPDGLEDITDSLTFDYIVCLEDGDHVVDLGTHLRNLGIEPDDYRRKWGLPDAYPMQAPASIMRHGATYEYDDSSDRLRSVG